MNALKVEPLKPLAEKEGINAAIIKDNAIPKIIPKRATIKNSIMNNKRIWSVSAPLSLSKATSSCRYSTTIFIVKIVKTIPIIMIGIINTTEMDARE